MNLLWPLRTPTCSHCRPRGCPLRRLQAPHPRQKGGRSLPLTLCPSPFCWSWCLAVRSPVSHLRYGVWECMTINIATVFLDNTPECPPLEVRIIEAARVNGTNVGRFSRNQEPETPRRGFFNDASSSVFGATSARRPKSYPLALPFDSIVHKVIRLRYGVLLVRLAAFRESGGGGLPVTRWLLDFSSM